MIKFDFIFDGLDEIQKVVELLLDLEKEIDEESLLMKETTVECGKYLITLLYGYESLEECVVSRLKKW